ncbi:uncharacterized protein LAESUDRAFT_299952 [Laetiporus sulphureus 93-53]|uniref:Uncharacterized protein n=1 Tax=Laetiporus sulphureus 93-53 TaxID=1314785 RepID=A0A165DC83_9APHY|nr:uncharacterized protein LAESUDRAFT_299952 [Laetiporus sulphureus 93-53]KZT04541.1 hypothetical protein LAESUDRAFT_299952 [Laetiporus sulphureus 93-53]
MRNNNDIDSSYCMVLHIAVIKCAEIVCVIIAWKHFNIQAKQLCAYMLQSMVNQSTREGATGDGNKNRENVKQSFGNNLATPVPCLAFPRATWLT